MSGRDFLGEILARKRLEVARRIRHGGAVERMLEQQPFDAGRGARAVEALRRGDARLPRVIAEVKFASPSAGVIRPRSRDSVQSIARGYVAHGAAAVSVLADRPGFMGGPLDVRRATSSVGAPVLFKEFVLDPCQVRLARAVGASLVLLLVRALSPKELGALSDAIRREGMEPVVEAADEAELEVAIASGATIVGVNARDLRTFSVDPVMAARAMERIPSGRIAVFMSGIRERADLDRVAATRADAVLVGEGLMRAPDPGARLGALLGDS